MNDRLSKLERRAGIGEVRFCPNCGRDLSVMPPMTLRVVTNGESAPPEPRCDCLGPVLSFTLKIEEDGEEHPSKRSRVPWTG